MIDGIEPDIKRRVCLGQTEQEFLNRLSEHATIYGKEPFFNAQDGHLVLKVRNGGFTLWPRTNNALLPIMEGKFESENNQVVLNWYFRAPWVPMLFYAAWFCFFVNLGRTEVLGSVLMLAVSSVLVAVMYKMRMPFIQSMENLVRSIASKSIREP